MSQSPRTFGKLFAVLAALIFVIGAYSDAFAVRSTPRTHKAPAKLKRASHRHRMRWNPLFRPSHESLIRQNQEIDRIELPRIQDDAQLEDLKSSRALVPIEASESLRIEPSLDPSRRFCRPWTRDFVEDLAEVYYRHFGEQIQVNSAVRTVTVQKKLRRRNRNAAPAEGETASSHLAGVTVDLQRRGMNKEQVRFVERYLFYLNQLGLVEPEEERRHWCFHVMVSDRYQDWRQSQSIFPQHLPVEDTVTAMGASK